jgi:FkbM family methyltransferase
LVEKEGLVYCFEPTKIYSDILKLNLQANKAENVRVIKKGLSNKKQELKIHIGESSASVHIPGNYLNEATEIISLITLDEFIEQDPLEKIDLIKVDIDGHEPLFLEGACKTIEKYDPIILMEVSHLHYLEAGYTAWDIYEMLKRKKFNIYHEDGLSEITTKEQFLIKCGNFAYSSNIIISRKKIAK